MIISEVERNSKEKIIVSIQEFKNRHYIDCQIYFRDDTNKLIPTRKGITLNDETADAIIEGLKTAKSRLKG